MRVNEPSAAPWMGFRFLHTPVCPFSEIWEPSCSFAGKYLQILELSAKPEAGMLLSPSGILG